MEPRRVLGGMALRSTLPPALGVVVGLLAASVLAPTSGAPASPSAGGLAPASGIPLAWSNGVVVCTFPGAGPTLGMQGVGASGSGLAVGVATIAEEDESGASRAVGYPDNASWNATNASTGDLYNASYSTLLLVFVPGTGLAGHAGLSVHFSLAAYQDGTGRNLSSVEFGLALANWPWQASTGDHLVFELTVRPNSSSTEHLAQGAGTNPVVTSVLNATSSPHDFFALEGSATLTPSGGSAGPVPVAPSVTTSSSLATFSIPIGNGSDAFSAVSFLAHVGLIVPRSVAGLPLYDYAAVVGGALLVSVAAAAATRRIRRGPSPLLEGVPLP